MATLSTEETKTADNALPTGTRNADREAALARLKSMFAKPDYAFSGTFEEATTVAEEAGLWLILSIECLNNIMSYIISSTVWNNEEFFSNIMECKAVFFQIDRDSHDGSWLLSKFKKYGYKQSKESPFVCIINPFYDQAEQTFNFKEKSASFQSDALALKIKVSHYLNESAAPKSNKSDFSTTTTLLGQLPLDNVLSESSLRRTLKYIQSNIAWKSFATTATGGASGATAWNEDLFCSELIKICGYHVGDNSVRYLLHQLDQIIALLGFQGTFKLCKFMKEKHHNLDLMAIAGIITLLCKQNEWHRLQHLNSIMKDLYVMQESCVLVIGMLDVYRQFFHALVSHDSCTGHSNLSSEELDSKQNSPNTENTKETEQDSDISMLRALSVLSLDLADQLSAVRNPGRVWSGVQQQLQPICLCGSKLIEKQSGEAYSDDSRFLYIICDICNKNITSKNEKVYHCVNNNTSIHDKGYDICSECAWKHIEKLNKYQALIIQTLDESGAQQCEDAKHLQKLFEKLNYHKVEVLSGPNDCKPNIIKARVSEMVENCKNSASVLVICYSGHGFVKTSQDSNQNASEKSFCFDLESNGVLTDQDIVSSLITLEESGCRRHKQDVLLLINACFSGAFTHNTNSTSTAATSAPKDDSDRSKDDMKVQSDSYSFVAPPPKEVFDRVSKELKKMGVDGNFVDSQMSKITIGIDALGSKQSIGYEACMQILHVCENLQHQRKQVLESMTVLAATKDDEEGNFFFTDNHMSVFFSSLVAELEQNDDVTPAKLYSRIAHSFETSQIGGLSLNGLQSATVPVHCGKYSSDFFLRPAVKKYD